MPDAPVPFEGADQPTFTDEEFAELFETPARPPGERRRLPAWTRMSAVIAAVAMLAGTITILVETIGDFASLNDAAAIREAALDRAAESEWGWLATDIRIVPIPEPRVGAFVTNNPPDGIIQIDLRPWSPDRLDRLVDHELGHLVDFAIWGPVPPGERRGGLGSEAWAECAAVAAGTRDLDTRIDDDDPYHCVAEELEVWQSEMDALVELCARWGERECRTLGLGADGVSDG